MCLLVESAGLNTIIDPFGGGKKDAILAHIEVFCDLEQYPNPLHVPQFAL